MKKLVLALVLSLTACSSIPHICRPDSAHEAGVAQAMRGETMAYGIGAACTEDNRNVFRKNLEAGYQEGRARYCDPADVERRAAAAGQAGEATGFREARFRVCEGGTADLRAAYGRGYAQGLAEFCAPPAVQASGRQQGEAGAPGAFPTERYGVCKGYPAVRASYANGYREGIAKFCEGDDAEGRGFREGNQGMAKSLMHGRFGVCTAEQRRHIQELERVGYERGLGQFCGADSIETEAGRNAEEADQPRFPEKFAVCGKGARERYKDAFIVARNRVVASLCNYEKGVERGLNDGAANRKDTSMPPFCVQNLYGVYFQGYMEGWKQAKRSKCDGEKAYDKGLADAAAGWMVSYTPPGECPDEFAHTMRARYRDGYMAGKAAQSAPSHVAQVPGNCSREVTNRTGSSDFSRCSASGATIACYHEVRETCRNPYDGEATTRNFREYTGRCVSSYGDCW